MDRAFRLALGAIVSGLLLALALPPHGWSPLGWVAFVPALVAVEGLGFAFGFGSGIAVCLVAAWLDAHGFLLKPGVMDGTPDWIYAGFLLFGLVSGFAMGLWAASSRLRENAWAMAAWAVLFEAALLVYLPAHMALTQSRSTALLYLSSWTGIWGVSYLVWLSNFAIARSILTGRRRRAVLLAAAGCLLSLSWLPAERGDLKIAMIQTRSTDADELTAMNRRAGSQGAALAVWPELSGMVMATGGRMDDLTKVAQANGQPAFVTTYEEPAEPLPYNVARMFSQSGPSSEYRKRKPFAGETQMHQAGQVAAEASAGGTTYGLNICFDSCFPAIMRDTARQPGVQVIVLPTLDPDTPYGVTQSLHAAYTPFRAAELGLPIVRSDITAYSMAVDGWGRVLAETGTDQDDVFTAAVRPGRRWTFAAAAGDWFLFACGLVALISIVWKKGSSEKRLGPRPDDAIERVEDASSLGDGYELGARTSSG